MVEFALEEKLEVPLIFLLLLPALHDAIDEFFLDFLENACLKNVVKNAIFVSLFDCIIERREWKEKFQLFPKIIY